MVKVTSCDAVKSACVLLSSLTAACCRLSMGSAGTLTLQTPVTGGTNRMIKRCFGLILAAAMLTAAAGASAAPALSPEEVIEQVAVPMAQKNDDANYSNDELKELITVLNENGITLDESSEVMQAYASGHGYWERETLREICLSVFGSDEKAWTIDQRYCYGEIMVAIGAFGLNVCVLPGEGDMSVEDAHILAAHALEDAFDIDLPLQSDAQWLIYESFGLGLDVETGSYPPKNARWSFVYFDRASDRSVYTVSFDRAGGDIQTSRHDESEDRSDTADATRLTDSGAQEAMEHFGEMMHFWPPEMVQQVFGDDYAVPSEEEYRKAVQIAEDAVMERYGETALTGPAPFQIGVLHQRFDDTAEAGRVQLNWDFVFTTDPDHISDGYRVQFIQFQYTDGKEEIDALTVGPANMGNG